MEESLNYKDAMEELETIVDAIESPDVDLDTLAEKVERASILVAFCRKKIASTEVRVQEIISELNEPTTK